MTSIESDLASLQRVLERVQSAKSEDVSTVLSALLPKLVPLVNQDALRTKAMSVVSESLKRLRLVKCELNIAKLLPCIHPSMQPYAANIAVTVVDKVIEHGVIILQSDHLDIAKSLLMSIGTFDAYSPQSNALCYYALVHFHDVLIQQFPIIKSSNTIDSTILTKAQQILGDFLVDIALLQRPLVIETSANASGTAGSVQPGLSQIRVDRIINRKKTWSPDQLKTLKLAIINAVPSGLLLPVHAVLVSVVLVNDADAAIATQATYKMNGCANMLAIDQDTVTVGSVCEGILSICSKETAVLGSPGYSRSVLRADVRLSALRWLVKYLPEHLAPQARQIVRYVFQLVFSGNSTVSVASLLNEEVAVVGASFQLLEVVLRHLDSTTLTEVVLLVMVCIKKVLQSFAFSTSSSSAGEHHMQLRSSCYRVVECIATRYTATGRQERERAIDSLALQNQAQEETAVLDVVSVDCTITTSSAVVVVASSVLLLQLQKVTVEDAELLMLLFQLLDREHAYHIEASILAIYRAMNSLREGYVFMKENDTSTSNANTGNNMLSLKELLRKVRRSDRDVKMRLAALQWARALFHWDAFVLETLFLLADDESSAVVVFAVTEFKRLERFLRTALSDVGSAEYEVAVRILSDVIALLLSNGPAVSQGSVLSSMRGMYLLLSAAATGLRLVASHSGSLIPAGVASLDLAGLIRLCAGIPVELPVLQIPGLSLEQGSGVYFTSLRALTGTSDGTPDASAAGPEGVEEEQAGTLAPAVTKSSRATTICAPILRCIASLSACALRLAVSSNGNSDHPSALTQSCLLTGRSVVGNYLTWLNQPEVDIRQDLKEIFTHLCVSDLALCGDSAHTLEEELNHLSTLQRQLTHKLAPLRDIAQADLTQLRTAAGALTCLGAVSVRLQQLSVTESASSLVVESTRTRSAVIAQLIVCMQVDSKQSFEHILLQVVALEVLGQLNETVCGTLSSETEKELDALKSLLLPLLHLTEPRIVVPAVGTYAQLSTASTVSISGFWEHVMVPALLCTDDYSIKFAWAQAVMHICTQPLSIAELRELAAPSQCVQKILVFVDSKSYIADDSVPVMVAYLLSLIDEASLSSTDTLAERSTYCVALLVLVKACAPGRAFPKVYVRSIVDVLLRFLKDKDVFLQDICCMALCHLYSTADRTVPAVEAHAVLAGLAGQPISVSDYIAQEVMLVLMRERRAPQPVGYSAGATTSSRTAAAQRNASTTPGTGSATADTGAVAGGGGGAPAAEVNHLMQAAVAAAAELGVGLRLESVGAEEIGSAQQGEGSGQQAPQDYVVYSSICKMAKSAKDNNVLFAVLALIRRDPVFGTGSSRVYSREYASPQVTFPTAKLVQMLPMLFHARFDPNNTVRPVMRALWDALMQRHFPQQQHMQLDLVQRAVVSYLCQKLHSPQWRDREAACLALEAFLPRRSWQVSVFPLLEQLFHSALRVLDDMRDSTRTAAIAFTKALSSHIVRACTPEESSAEVVSAALDKIMPLLLEKGLVAPSAEARGVSLGLLGKVVEAGRTAPALRQWLAQVISVLIEGMSAMEPQTLQYMQFHTARLRISEEELESMRIKMAQSSPLHDALESCLGALQQAVLHDATTSLVPEVVRSLCSQLQRGVGLPTRVAAAQALSQMVERYPAHLAPGSSGAQPTAQAFRAIIWTLSQAPTMAVSLKKAMTSAFGVLAKVVDEEVLTEECAVLVDRYIFLERDQLDQSLVLAQCIQQIVQKGGQRLDEGIGSRMVMWNRILSCAFLGSHERDPECKAVWEATWEAALSASGAGTKLSALLRTFPTVVGMVHSMCKELSWYRRVQAVEVLREVIGVVPDATLVDQLRKIPQQTHALLRTLLSLIPGPVWGGQSAVLEAISEIVCKCEPFLTFTPSSCNETLVLEGSSEEMESELRVANLTSDGLMSAILSNMAPSLSGTEAVTEKRELWSLRFLGWVLVLVHESRRGSRSSGNLLEAEYRMAAARALSLLPWQRLCATMAGQNIFHRLLPILLKQSGIPPFGVPLSASDNSAGVGTDSPVDAGKSNRRSNKRTLGSAALFGVRYQQQPSKESATAERARTATATVATAPDAGTASSSPVLTTDEVVVAGTEEEEEAVTGEEMDVQDETETSSAAMVVEAEEAVAEAAPQSGGFVEVTHKHQPVYYLSYLDCLVRAWPKRSSVALPPGQQGHCYSDVMGNSSGLERYAGFVLDWAESVMGTQVWSIRRTAVQLLGTISSSGYFPEDVSSLARLLGVLEAGIQESKYAKVRVEALRSLALILQSSSPLRAGIDRDEALRSRVREIIRTASADSQPTILEAVAKVQNVWFA